MRTPAVIILGLLVLVGSFNYKRNIGLDAELDNRTHARLSDDELGKLIAAYESELARTQQQIGPPPDAQHRLDGIDASDVGARVKALEAFQRDSEAWKRRRREATDNRVMLESLQREQQIRHDGLDKAWRRVLRRVVTTNL